MSLQIGQIVEFQSKDSSKLQIGTILAISSKGIRILQLNKREVTVNERAILHHTTSPKVSVADIESALEKLSNYNSRRQQLTDSINLKELHEILLLEPRPYTLLEMANLISSQVDEDLQAALLRCLYNDSLYFRQKKEGFVPVSSEEVQAAIEREQKKQIQQKEDEALLEEFKLAKSGVALKDLRRLSSVINMLVQVVLWGNEAQIPKHFYSVLERAGFNSARSIFSFLVQIGYFNPDEHLELLKYKIHREFSEESLREVSEITSRIVSHAEKQNVEVVNSSINAACHTSADRKNLTELFTIAIDSEKTRDRDDAFSIASTADGFTLWIHIADVASLIVPGSALDKDANLRGCTIYLPEGSITMLPPSISENFLSLNDDGVRPAMTWEINLDKRGNINNYQIYRSIVKIHKAIDYKTADNMLEEGNELLIEAFKLAKLRQERRKEAGALFIQRQPEVKIIISEDGHINLDYKLSKSPSTEIIMEFMLLVNHLAAKYCHDNEIPCLYRVQDASNDLPLLVEDFDPVAFYQALRTFKKVSISTQAGPHNYLGVSPYCQVSSPLRRYTDLIIQRQIAAHISGVPLPYSFEEFQKIAFSGEEAIQTAELVMQNRREYWILKYLQQELNAGNDTWSATIVDLNQNDAVVYCEVICDYRTLRRPEHEISVGQKVKLKVKKIDLFDRILRFEIVQ